MFDGKRKAEDSLSKQNSPETKEDSFPDLVSLFRPTKQSTMFWVNQPFNVPTLFTTPFENQNDQISSKEKPKSAPKDKVSTSTAKTSTQTVKTPTSKAKTSTSTAKTPASTNKSSTSKNKPPTFDINKLYKRERQIIEKYHEKQKEIPSYKKIEKMVWDLVHEIPIVFIPIRIPELLNKIRLNEVPEYFLYTILTLCQSYSLNTIDSIASLQKNEHFLIKSIELLKQNSTSRDPYFIWACTLISTVYLDKGHFHKAFEALEMASVAIKVEKYYSIDLKRRIIRKSEDPDVLEFKRRIWWGYYISNRILVSRLHIPISIDESEVFVKFPTNDFIWKYGGNPVGCGRKIVTINQLAKHYEEKSIKSHNHFELICQGFLLYGNISKFISRRWLRNWSDGEEVYKQLLSKIEMISNLQAKIDNNSKLVMQNFTKNNEVISSVKKDSSKVEYVHISLYLQLMIRCLKIILYRSELNSCELYSSSPKRTKAAKIACLEASLESVKLFEWGSSNLSKKQLLSLVSFWSFPSSIILINADSIKHKTMGEQISHGNNYFKNIFENNQTTHAILHIYHLLLNHLEKIKTASTKISLKEERLLLFMGCYSLNDNDMLPWTIPQHSFLLNHSCCIRYNFPSLIVDEYLCLIKDKGGLVSIPKKNTRSNPKDDTGSFKLMKNLGFSLSSTEIELLKTLSYSSEHFSKLYKTSEESQFDDLESTFYVPKEYSSTIGNGMNSLRKTINYTDIISTSGDSHISNRMSGNNNAFSINDGGACSSNHMNTDVSTIQSIFIPKLESTSIGAVNEGMAGSSSANNQGSGYLNLEYKDLNAILSLPLVNQISTTEENDQTDSSGLKDENNIGML
ncbi:hypothetical protein BB558_007075 [Smittium angustum]|uniref:Xylanolytic transcriptional activator regulatory domain-containing protein n=1 Tax=Smittium angustum TaxID=133377 RepID=A0A2U1IVY4_SMIAN|nr:hypothetical protein BB558_007075 [Smittium angustum]